MKKNKRQDRLRDTNAAGAGQRQGDKMKKQFENDATMERIGYSVAQGKAIWGKTLDSGEITIEDYLKRIDPAGIVWKDDGSLPLFDFSQEKIIEHIKTIKTFKKANDYLSKLEIIYSFIIGKNGGGIPRNIGFNKLRSMIEIDTVRNRQSVFRSLKDMDMDKPYNFHYWQFVDGINVSEKQLRNWNAVGLTVDGKTYFLEADKSKRPPETTRRKLESFLIAVGRMEDNKK